MIESLTVSPTPELRRVRTADGVVLTAPETWSLLPPGDPGLTRRVKAAGSSWTVIEKRGRKSFSRGVWAPSRNIEAARVALEAERETPAYAKRRAADASRREREQVSYTVDFDAACRAFLRFSPPFAMHEARLAAAVVAHATPVGSGTVARTERIPIERRAEAAVVAWLRHQTTAYDSLAIPRVKGARREVRRALAEVSRALLDAHRRPSPHAAAHCPLCRALALPGASHAYAL